MFSNSGSRLHPSWQQKPRPTTHHRRLWPMANLSRPLTLPNCSSLHFPPSARLIRLFPHMTEILLSIGLLCDHGCTAHFYKHYRLIRYHSIIILTGTRNKSTNYLWTLDRPANTPDLLTALEPHTNQPEQKMFSATQSPQCYPSRAIDLWPCHPVFPSTQHPRNSP